jgi:hypothetical protein
LHVSSAKTRNAAAVANAGGSLRPSVQSSFLFAVSSFAKGYRRQVERER